VTARFFPGYTPGRRRFATTPFLCTATFPRSARTRDVFSRRCLRRPYRLAFAVCCNSEPARHLMASVRRTHPSPNCALAEPILSMPSRGRLHAAQIF